MNDEQKQFLAGINNSLEDMKRLFEEFGLEIEFNIKPKNSTEDYHWTISNY